MFVTLSSNDVDPPTRMNSPSSSSGVFESVTVGLIASTVTVACRRSDSPPTLVTGPALAFIVTTLVCGPGVTSGVATVFATRV